MRRCFSLLLTLIYFDFCTIPFCFYPSGMDARSSTQFNAVQCITQNFPFGISEHIAPLPLPTPWDRESCWRFVCQPCRARSCSKVLCTPLTKLESTLLITATHTISTRQRDYLRPIPPCPLFFSIQLLLTSG